MTFPLLVGLGLNAASAVSVLRSPHISAARKLLLVATRTTMGYSMTRPFVPEVQSDLTSSNISGLDGLLFASAIMGNAAEPRSENDFRKDWRQFVSGAIGDYALPEDGLRRMMVDLARNAPLHVDAKNAGEWHELMRAYRRAEFNDEAGEVKIQAQKIAYEYAVEAFQHIKFGGGIRAVETDQGTDVIDARWMRLTLNEHLFFEEKAETKEGLQEVLATPTMFGYRIAAFIPDIYLYAARPGGVMRRTNLIECLRGMSPGRAIDLAFFYNPLTGPHHLPI